MKVAARPGHWQNTKRTLEEGTNGLGTRDVYDYRRPGGCLEDVLTGVGSAWVISVAFEPRQREKQGPFGGIIAIGLCGKLLTNLKIRACV